jgi:hypothetical protein
MGCNATTNSNTDSTPKQPHVDALLALKKRYKELTGGEYTAAGAPAPAKPAAAAAAPAGLKGEGAALADKIVAKGEEIRKLKAGKADKQALEVRGVRWERVGRLDVSSWRRGGYRSSILSFQEFTPDQYVYPHTTPHLNYTQQPHIAALLALKQEFKKATGQEYQAPGAAPAPAAAASAGGGGKKGEKKAAAPQAKQGGGGAAAGGGAGGAGAGAAPAACACAVPPTDRVGVYAHIHTAQQDIHLTLTLTHPPPSLTHAQWRPSRARSSTRRASRTWPTWTPTCRRAATSAGSPRPRTTTPCSRTWRTGRAGTSRPSTPTSRAGTSTSPPSPRACGRPGPSSLA